MTQGAEGAPPDAEGSAEVARTLQRGLGPDVSPAASGLKLQSRYRSGGLGDVGGDWLDGLELPQGGAAIVIGDVAGRGINAAATMGQLRYGLRAYLLEDDAPGAALGRLNRLAIWTLPGHVASVLVAVFSPERSFLRLASAGHLPPLLFDADDAKFLSLNRGPVLGVAQDREFAETTHDLPSRMTLLLFTDGLVERRGESIDDGLARLAQVARASHGQDDLCDRLVAQVPDLENDDDLAVIAVQRAGGS